MAKPDKPTGLILTDKLDLTDPTKVYVYGPGYQAGHDLLLKAKASKKRWKGILANVEGNLWRSHVTFIGVAPGEHVGKVELGPEDMATTITNPADPTHPSDPLTIVGVVIP